MSIFWLASSTLAPTLLRVVSLLMQACAHQMRPPMTTCSREQTSPSRRSLPMRARGTSRSTALMFQRLSPWWRRLTHQTTDGMQGTAEM